MPDREDGLPPASHPALEAMLGSITTHFEDYLLRLPLEEQRSLTVAVDVMKALLLQTLAPKRVAGN